MRSRPLFHGRRVSQARRADRFALYQRAVQSVQAEVDFVVRTFRRLRGRPLRRLREDFCGTAAVACEWVRRGADHVAVGLDIDPVALAWGLRHNVARLPPGARARVRLLRRNVLAPGPGTGRMDAVLALNFSYWVFKDRRTLGRYFRRVHHALVRDGLFVLDVYGGWEAYRRQRERRRLPGRCTYIWEQAGFDPVSGALTCHIHFRFADGSRLRRAFTYDWRLWSIPEIRELLAQAGFARSTVYWEGDDGRGRGDGVFRPVARGEDCPAFVAYVVAEK